MREVPSALNPVFEAFVKILKPLPTGPFSSRFFSLSQGLLTGPAPAVPSPTHTKLL